MSSRTLLVYLFLPLAAVIALKVLVILAEPYMTFFPIRDLSNAPETDSAFEEFSMMTEDGETIYAWHFEHPEPLAEAVFFHGNGGNLFLWQEFLRDIYEHSFTVLAVDYRGYGKSTGSPTEKGLYLDTAALVEHFWDEVHLKEEKVVYWGRSLGGVTAAFAATLREPDALILEATFPSKTSLLKHYPVMRFLSLFSRFEFPTEKFLQQVSCPVLIIHGTQDSVVPFQQGRLLFQQLQGPKSFHEVPGADHNNLHLVSPAAYWQSIREFIHPISHGRHTH